MKLFIPLLSIVMIFGCNETNLENLEVKKTEIPGIVPDTIVGNKTITNEIAGSAYRNRATSYFVVIGNDTSIF